MLANHTANLVGASLGLGDHAANFVANRAGAWLANCLAAVNRFLCASWYAYSLAASSVWAFAAQRAARTWAVDATALRSIIAEGTWLTNGLGVDLAWDGVSLSFPAVTTDLDRLGVRNFHANVISFFTLTSFPNWLVHRVRASLGFPDWLLHRVRNLFGASFPNWLVHGVRALTGFPDRLVHGVRASFGFPNRLVHGVANVASLGFPNRLVHRVRASLGFPNRLAHGVANLFLSLLTYVACAVDNFVFADAVVYRTTTSLLDFFPLGALHRFHDGVALPLWAARRTAVVSCSSAVPRPCYRRQHNNGDGSESLQCRFCSHCFISFLDHLGKIESLVKMGAFPSRYHFDPCKHCPLARCCFFSTPPRAFDVLTPTTRALQIAPPVNSAAGGLDGSD